MTQFELLFGIDYSGARLPTSRLPGLQVYGACAGQMPRKWTPPVNARGRATHWTRAGIAQLLLQRARSGPRFLAGIDHGFSFPMSYFERHGLTSWAAFLADFAVHWPTDQDDVSVQSVRDALHTGGGGPGSARDGRADELRLCERWTSSARSVFQFDMQGSVAKSTHAGIPWLQWLRGAAGDRIHFWPFDGWRPASGKSVVVEIYPSIFRRRYPPEGRSADEQDAYAGARVLADMALRGALDSYFWPCLTEEERACADLEGWIFGVL